VAASNVDCFRQLSLAPSNGANPLLDPVRTVAAGVFSDRQVAQDLYLSKKKKKIDK
jgi:hypothetical protein